MPIKSVLPILLAALDIISKQKRYNCNPDFCVICITSSDMQVYTPESLGESFALLQGPFLSIVLTSEDTMIQCVVQTEANINNNIFHNQQSKVYFYHFTGLKALV